MDPLVRAGQPQCFTEAADVGERGVDQVGEGPAQAALSHAATLPLAAHLGKAEVLRRPVSKLVNSVRNEVAELLEHVEGVA